MVHKYRRLWNPNPGGMEYKSQGGNPQYSSHPPAVLTLQLRLELVFLFRAPAAFRLHL
ncbi:hypothetical protein DM860_013353 [Cuscuta australis]|uniref:Uncharacterized protein n=1 Tax=Cuscuta australis TaxID=267555 RepID=A0A328DRW4_9ASTE|nr:hypothetical protein DM860_013353 [Cuscuta australis]